MKLLKWFFILVIIPLSGCASPYIGRPVETSDPAVCECYTMPVSCSVQYGRMEIQYTIEKLGTQKYQIKGEALYTGSITWDTIQRGTIIVLLIKAGDVVGKTSAAIRCGSTEKPIPFKRIFEFKNKFDHVMVGYEAHVKG